MLIDVEVAPELGDRGVADARRSIARIVYRMTSLEPEGDAFVRDFENDYEAFLRGWESDIHRFLAARPHR